MDFMLLADGAKMTVGEKFSLGGCTFLLGVAMVFVVLGILIGFITIIKLIMAASAKRKIKKLETKDKKAIEAPLAAVSSAKSNDDEIAAAISAAIAMIYAEENRATSKSVKFKVRSIKEIR